MAMSEQDFYKQPTQPGFSVNEPFLPPPEPLPEKIGPYKIESLLEKGGMSLVYLGTHPETKDPITIKVLLPKFLSHPEIVTRFVNEAEIIAMADHPNIVKLYGQGQWEGGVFIAMEFIQGVSLRQMLQHTPISLKRGLEIIIDIAYALCHLHTHGVIHRDLKPENILITEDGTVKVIDFGIAQLMNEKIEGEPVAKNRFLGTPFYMSPEQKQNPENVSFSSDIYALGIITYEVVLGKLSHGQIHLSLMPKGLQKILTKALQPDPKDRYQDVVDFITDISAYLNSESLEKERKGGDQLNEMSEQLQQVQASLIGKAPQWPGIEIGSVNYKGMAVAGIYSDFIPLMGGKYGILIAESSAKGAAGVVHTAGFRGMARSMARFVGKPVELASLLNELISHDPANQIITMSYLILSPKENLLSYVSCGYGTLWHIPAGRDFPQKITAENIALGVDKHAKFADINQTWDPGDTLILSTFVSAQEVKEPHVLDESIVQQMLIENLHLPAQKQTEILMRKIKGILPRSIEDRPISIISIHR